jgi:hypothetical protein
MFTERQQSKTLVVKLLGNCQTGREGGNKKRNRGRRESEKVKENINMCYTNVYCWAGMSTE